MGLKEFMELEQHLIKQYESLLEKHKPNNYVSPKTYSEALRQKGNGMYRRKQFQAALDLYTESIKSADWLSKEEQLCYGNRSAVNFELKNYKLSLKDIENAFFSNQDEHNTKLIMRKASCLFHEGNFNSAQEECERLTKLVRDTGITLSAEEKEKLQSLQNDLRNTTQDHMSQECIELFHGAHVELTSASCAVTLSKSEAKGRYLITNEHVPKGSVLIMEKPYVSVLLPEFWSTHCYNCHLDCSGIPVFCRRRSCGIQYCSCHCEATAWSSYHQYECSVLHVVVNTGIGHLAYRVVTYAGFNRLMEHRESLEGSNSFSAENKKYDEVYNLVTNEDKILPADQYHYMKTAVLLLMCAFKVNFFPTSMDILDRDSVYVGDLLLRHIQQLICNAHAITHVNVSVPQEHDLVLENNQTKLASAIYPTASLMNHSCVPNISVSFVGSTLIVKNTVALELADEIFNCYGPHYLKMNKKDRQEALMNQYYFLCNCDACQSEDGVEVKVYCCKLCSGACHLMKGSGESKCTSCGSRAEISKEVDLVTSALKKLNDEKIDIRSLVVSRKILEANLYKYSIYIARAHDLEAKHYATIGDMNSCSESLRKSINILENIYGKESVEIAHEYHKLSEVLYNKSDHASAQKYATKAKELLIQFYSSTHPLIAEIDKLCSQIKKLNMA